MQGIKPLSRWEKPLQDRDIALLGELELLTSRIPRTVKNGNTITETIFSRTGGYIQLYESHFAGTLVNKSPATQRIEGFLFGFPPCCVDQYIKQPYRKNNLPPTDQEILFHWACNNCQITPLLLPAYRSAHNQVNNC